MSIFLTFWNAIKANPGTSIGGAISLIVGILVQSGMVTTPAGIAAIGVASGVAHIFAGDASASTPAQPPGPPAK